MPGIRFIGLFLWVLVSDFQMSVHSFNAHGIYPIMGQFKQSLGISRLYKSRQFLRALHQTASDGSIPSNINRSLIICGPSGVGKNLVLSYHNTKQ